MRRTFDQSRSVPPLGFLSLVKIFVGFAQKIEYRLRAGKLDKFALLIGLVQGRNGVLRPAELNANFANVEKGRNLSGEVALWILESVVVDAQNMAENPQRFLLSSLARKNDPEVQVGH